MLVIVRWAKGNACKSSLHVVCCNSKYILDVRFFPFAVSLLLLCSADKLTVFSVRCACAKDGHERGHGRGTSAP